MAVTETICYKDDAGRHHTTRFGAEEANRALKVQQTIRKYMGDGIRYDFRDLASYLMNDRNAFWRELKEAIDG